MDTRRRSASAGFTLVEILVVVAVIGILAAIIFAVIGRVRESGRRTVCQNNLKQLALAVQQYVADSDGRLPTDRFQPQLHPYIKASNWIECPTHEALSLSKQELSIEALDSQNWYIYGYTYNGSRLNRTYKIGSSLERDSKHEASFPNAATTWLFGDDDPILGIPAGPGQGGFWNPSDCGIHVSWAKLHNGGANYAFLDGHVKWLKPGAINEMHCSSQPAQ